MLHRFAVGLFLLVATSARAEEVEPAPLPPLDEDADDAVELSPPAPENSAPAPEDVPLTETLAADVARDTYLGGAGIIGPLGLLGVSGYAAPILGGLAAGWVSEQSHPRLRGQWVRGITAALAVMLVTSAMSIPMIMVASVASSVVGTVASLGMSLIPVTFPISDSRVGALSTGVGLALLLGGVGLAYVLMPFATGAYSALTNLIAVKVGDHVWDTVWTRRGLKRPSERQGFLGARFAGEPPLDPFMAGAVIAAAAKGAAVRRTWMEAIPMVGPLVFYFFASDEVVTRAEEAREVAGYSGGRLATRFGKPLLLVRALLATAAVGFVPLIGLSLCGLAGVALVGGGLGMVTPGLAVAAMLGVLGGLLPLAFALVPLLALALAAVALDAVTPWTLAWLALRGTQPIEQADEEGPED